MSHFFLPCGKIRNRRYLPSRQFQSAAMRVAAVDRTVHIPPVCVLPPNFLDHFVDETGMIRKDIPALLAHIMGSYNKPINPEPLGFSGRPIVMYCASP